MSPFNCVSTSKIPIPIIQMEILVYDYLFTSQFQTWIFCFTFTYLVPFGVIENRITKVTFKYLMEILQRLDFLTSLSLSWKYLHIVTCILSRQLVSLKKMVELSAEFTILTSWSRTCIPLILYWH